MNILEPLIIDLGELRFCPVLLHCRASLLQHGLCLEQRRTLLRKSGGHFRHFEFRDELSLPHAIADVKVNGLEIARDLCVDVTCSSAVRLPVRSIRSTKSRCCAFVTETVTSVVPV